MKKWMIAGLCAVVLLLAVFLFLIFRGYPCALLDGIKLESPRFVVQWKMGEPERESAFPEGAQRYLTYTGDYEGVPVEITFTFLETTFGDKLFGLSIRSTQPLSGNAVTTVLEGTKDKIRGEYGAQDGYYETSSADTFCMGINEGATGIDFTLEREAHGFVIRCQRIA